MNTWRETKARDVEWLDMTYRDWKHKKHREQHLGSDCTEENSTSTKDTKQTKKTNHNNTNNEASEESRSRSDGSRPDWADKEDIVQWKEFPSNCTRI